MGPEVYWQIRAAAEDVRRWLTSYYSGNKSGMAWYDLWCAAESVDVTLAGVYQAAEHSVPGGGYPAVCNALLYDDRLETWLSRLAAEVTLLQTGDQVMASDLLASRPPGATPLAPEWALTSARDTARVTALQRNRLRTGKAGGDSLMGGEDDTASAGVRRPRRRGGSSSGSQPTAGAKGTGASSSSSTPAKRGGGGAAS